jgi:hypothetical protein
LKFKQGFRTSKAGGIPLTGLESKEAAVVVVAESILDFKDSETTIKNISK